MCMYVNVSLQTVQAPWVQLPPFGAATSRCSSLPGFEPRSRFPSRSPLVVADHLISLVAGKAFVEVGAQVSMR